jgi:hypothetical protein
MSCRRSALVKEEERLTLVTLLLPVTCQQPFRLSVEVFIWIIREPVTNLKSCFKFWSPTDRVYPIDLPLRIHKFWALMPSNLVELYRRFSGTYFLRNHLP